MDPIRPKFTPNIQPPTVPDAGKPAADATKFAVAGTPQPATAQGVNHPVFSQMASHIQDAVSRSLTRDQVRDEVIDREVKNTFGGRATPEMTSAVSEAFRNDPHLSQLFDQLYAKATAKK